MSFIDLTQVSLVDREYYIAMDKITGSSWGKRKRSCVPEI